MGVDVEYYLMIGVKSDYNTFHGFKDKNALIKCEESDYFDTSEYKHCIITDYLPPDYTVISDGMSCEYSVVGKVLDKTEYLDTIRSFEINPFELERLTEEVYKELINLGIKDIVSTDVKLISFVHFS